jgi:hypothetical protein
VLGEIDLAFDVELVDACQRELEFSLLFFCFHFPFLRYYVVLKAFKIEHRVVVLESPPYGVTHRHDPERFSVCGHVEESFFHIPVLLLCPADQQAGEEAEFLGTVALAVTFALFDGILDGLRNIACASDVGAFCIFVYNDLPGSIL